MAKANVVSADGMRAYAQWADVQEGSRLHDFRSYIVSVAESRYVTRRVLRLIDDQAVRFGLEPMQHQALLQVHGHKELPGPSINQLADRLDIVPAFASRLVKELESRGAVERGPSEFDKRVTRVVATTEGVQLLVEIDHAVHVHMAALQEDLSEDSRYAALSIYAFYVGLGPDTDVARALRRARSLEQ